MVSFEFRFLAAIRAFPALLVDDRALIQFDNFSQITKYPLTPVRSLEKIDAHS